MGITTKILLVFCSAAMSALWVACGEQAASDPRAGIPTKPRPGPPALAVPPATIDPQIDRLLDFLWKSLNDPNAAPITRQGPAAPSVTDAVPEFNRAELLNAIEETNRTTTNEVPSVDRTPLLARSGQKPQSFEAVLTDGTVFNLDSTKGSPTLLVFWAPW